MNHTKVLSNVPISQVVIGTDVAELLLADQETATVYANSRLAMEICSIQVMKAL